MRTLLLTVLYLAFSLHHLTSQDIGGIINNYAIVNDITSTPNCQTILSVSSSGGFSIGDYIIIIQMQGAAISELNDNTFGTISGMGNTGNFEKQQISNILGNDIYINGFLSFNYDPSSPLQITNLAQYANANVTSTLTCNAWNGSTGGILALEATGTLSLNTNIDVSGLGFRGGSVHFYTGGNTCNFFTPRNEWFYTIPSGYGGGKGEGIAEIITGKECGRGPQANGGGGGNDHNSGGGGGSNQATGGQGGINDEPGTFNCQGDFPGVGGLDINSTDKLFLGGGGGAGHGNNVTNGVGGLGGGIIIIYANTIIGNGNAILSNGSNGGSPSGGDGGGGGGAGGGIHLDIQNLTGTLNINAIGGNGGNTTNINQNRCFGPGGGGSGGYLLTDFAGAGITPDFSGGTPGVVTNSSNGCNGSNLGASAGQDGSIYPIPAIPSPSIGFDFVRE